MSNFPYWVSRKFTITGIGELVFSPLPELVNFPYGVQHMYILYIRSFLMGGEKQKTHSENTMSFFGFRPLRSLCRPKTTFDKKKSFQSRFQNLTGHILSIFLSKSDRSDFGNTFRKDSTSCIF